MRPARFTDADVLVDDTLARVGRRVVLAAPLGLGKSVPLVNSFYRRAKADPGLDLMIVTALTLQKPEARGDLERRFLGPLNDRLFAGYPEVIWLRDQRRGEVPSNVHIHEFFFAPGSRMHVMAAQREYVSTNYSYVVRDLIAAGVNVIAQMVAREGDTYSLSCNPDLTLDLLDYFREQERAGEQVAFLGQVNPHLPYMYGESELPAEAFHSLLVGDQAAHPLFGTPNDPVSLADYGIALHASCLIRDGGTLQLGIGSMGDAVTYLLQMRHRDNDGYGALLESAGIPDRYTELLENAGGTGPFTLGVYASTEMLVDGYLALYNSGILARCVYPNAIVQELLNEGAMSEVLDIGTLGVLKERGLLSGCMTNSDFESMRELGVFPPDARYDRGVVTMPNGVSIALDDDDCVKKLVDFCSDELQGGVIAHAGFFLGPDAFYEAIRQLSRSERTRIAMTRISFVNELYGDERLKRAQRQSARFLNSGLMVSLLGHVVSDGLEDGRVISGVGGQYNFVAMAHALDDGRSILMIRSTRSKAGKTRSNVVWSYGNVTIPRHLRDIIISEYGIADLRGHSDEQCIRRLLNITDSRFQDELMAEAKRRGKLDRDYRIPDPYRSNLPATIEAWFGPLRDQGSFGNFPYGTDFTPEEQVLGRALKMLGAYSQARRFPPGWWKHLGAFVATPAAARPYLERMNLDRPGSLRERLESRLVVYALALSGSI
ncbi:MAG: hypothetical protein E2O56_07110 [Gammaproteobacteria bacterium]|nr:MAG: hypothetical protein E2O56_07110 [Gammaproteobacteria bacterium]